MMWDSFALDEPALCRGLVHPEQKNPTNRITMCQTRPQSKTNILKRIKERAIIQSENQLFILQMKRKQRYQTKHASSLLQNVSAEDLFSGKTKLFFFATTIFFILF